MAINRITTQSISDGTITAAKVASDMATQAELDTKLNLSGGALTGALTTNSTVDGIDIATRDAVLTSTTTTAGAALPKAGGTMTGQILAPAGSASAPSYAFGAQSSTGMYKPGTNQLYFSVGGTRKIRVESTQIVLEDDVSVNNTLTVVGDLTVDTNTLFVDASENKVGIGTASPASILHLESSSETDLEIRRTGTLSNNNRIGQVMFRNDTDSVAAVAAYRESAEDDAYLGFLTQPTSGVLSERMRISSSGKVGIGTASPTAGLTISNVNGNTRYSSDAWSQYLVFDAADSGGGGLIWSKQSGTYNRAILANQGAMYMGRSTADDGSAAFINDLVITNGGAVGIGTTNIHDRLHVVGNLYLEDGSPEITFETTGSAHANWQIAAQEHVSNAFEISSGSQDSDASNDTFTPRLTILNNGNATFSGTVSATATATLLIINSAGTTVKTINGIG